MTSRVLFILKQRPGGPYGSWSYSEDGKSLPSGLSVSAGQIVDMLNINGIETKLVQVIDNNDIDREVSLFKPSHVIIEAFWVVPQKFEILRKLHPNVCWVIRNHSKLEFLSHEGGMIGWAIDYLRADLLLACNSHDTVADFKSLEPGSEDNVIYLGNYYKTPPLKHGVCTLTWQRWLRKLGIVAETRVPDEWRVGCFGAIRPLKNHLNQAVAAIIAANDLGVKLRFFINATRQEGERASSILNSLRALFARETEHELIELGWLGHYEFLNVIGTMDVVMQVSNSETFNIVAADAVVRGVPVITSPEVPWIAEEFTADATDIPAITKTLLYVCTTDKHGYVQQDQLLGLKRFVRHVKRGWLSFFE
jgi:hypothetical protein